MVFEDELAKTGKKSGRFMWVFKLLFVLCVLFVISLGVMSMVSGKGESLQKGVEQYLSVISGMQTEIGTVNYVGLFPSVIVDIEDVTFKSLEYPKEAAHIEKIYVSTSFWNVFFSNGKIGALEIKDVHAKRNVWGPRSLEIRKIALAQKGLGGKPAFVIDGDYGLDPLSLSVEMKTSGKMGAKSFSIAEEGGLSLKLGTLEVKGLTSLARGGGVYLDLQAIGIPEKVASGNLRVISKTGGGWQLDGALFVDDSKIETDLDIQNGIAGDIYVPVLEMSDFGEDKALGKLLPVLGALSSDPDAPLKKINLENSIDLDVNFARIQSKEKYLGQIAFNIKSADSILEIKPVKGTLHKGKLNGSLTVNAKTLPAKLDLELGIRQLVYASVGDEDKRSGSADVYIKADGSGETYKEILQKLNGRAALVGGEGTFESAALKLWGTGILASMLPNLNSESESQMNCMIAVFKIEEGIAKSNTVFMDMNKLTVVGKGEIDIPSAQIDLILKADPKDMSLGDVSVPVKISGSVFKPSIGADAVGLGLKLAQMFLGTINPAFWVYSMADLGVSEDHPCRKFIKSDGSNAAEKKNDAVSDNANSAKPEEELNE